MYELMWFTLGAIASWGAVRLVYQKRLDVLRAFNLKYDAYSLKRKP